MTSLPKRVRKKYSEGRFVAEHGSRNRLELTLLYGMGSQDKEKILEGIRELEQEHDEEAGICSPNHRRRPGESQRS
jgi:hypothetical protein